MKIFALSFFAFTVAAMAQVKVSDLPAASTLGGTEVFPTVQSATTKKATAAQIAEYARSVAASTLAPIASPTFTGTVTIPSGASIADYLSTASAASLYAPLANPTFSGVLTMSGGSNAVRVEVAGVYAGLVQNGINTNKNGFIYTLRFPTTVTGNYTVSLPDGANATLATQNGALGTPSSVTLTNATGLPIATGISGLGTGIATALAVNVGSAGAPVINGGALGTPSSGTGTNITGIPPANITGTAAVLGANTFTDNQTAPSFILTASGGTFQAVTGVAAPQYTAVGVTGNGMRVASDRIDFWISSSVVSTVTSGNFNLGSSAMAWSSNTLLHGNSDGLGRLVLRNSTNSQHFSIARTYTSFTDKEEVELGSTGTVFHLWSIKGSGGGTARDLVLGTNSTERIRLSASGLTIGTSGTPIAAVISAVATKDFDLTAVTIEDQTMTVTGAAVGDAVQLGVPNGSVTTTSQFTAWVSAADTVTIRCTTQVVGENPASGSFRATVTTH